MDSRANCYVKEFNRAQLSNLPAARQILQQERAGSVRAVLSISIFTLPRARDSVGFCSTWRVTARLIALFAITKPTVIDIYFALSGVKGQARGEYRGDDSAHLSH